MLNEKKGHTIKLSKRMYPVTEESDKEWATPHPDTMILSDQLLISLRLKINRKSKLVCKVWELLNQMSTSI